MLDPSGNERHRVEGFLPVDDFLAELEQGLARWAFERKDYAEAERRFQSICEQHPNASAAPGACYWAGVSKYKATNAAQALHDTAVLLQRRFPQSEWAKKASVWADKGVTHPG